MADRGYESFNTFAHLIRKGMYFVIRTECRIKSIENHFGQTNRRSHYFS